MRTAHFQQFKQEEILEQIQWVLELKVVVSTTHEYILKTSDYIGP